MFEEGSDRSCGTDINSRESRMRILEVLALAPRSRVKMQKWTSFNQFCRAKFWLGQLR